MWSWLPMISSKGAAKVLALLTSTLACSLSEPACTFPSGSILFITLSNLHDYNKTGSASNTSTQISQVVALCEKKTASEHSIILECNLGLLWMLRRQSFLSLIM